MCAALLMGGSMSKSWKRRRREAYPDVGEQLDALWKAVDALAEKKAAPVEVAAMRDRIAAVKAANPKPQGRG